MGLDVGIGVWVGFNFEKADSTSPFGVSTTGEIIWFGETKYDL